MLRFLKWIFFIFGGLGLCILTFFYIQNKHDLEVVFNHYQKLNYENIKSSCLNVKKKYYYPCFKNKFETYLNKVSLTGMSFGLKLAFNFIDEDKRNAEIFTNELERDLTYSLNYIELNNLALKNSYKRFFGLKFTYGGFVGKVQDNLEKASLFSDGIIAGLKGNDGITKLDDPIRQEHFYQRLARLIEDYQKAKDEVQVWLSDEIEKLESMY